MKTVRISDEDLYAVLNPATSREERKAAFMRSMEQAWQLGWEACAEEYAIASAAMAVRAATSVVDARARETRTHDL